MGSKPNRADRKAQRAANAELIEAAGRVAGAVGIRAASEAIGSKQGHQARMDALNDVLKHRT